MTNYVSSATYAPRGQPAQYVYGNTLYRNYTSNNRLQPTNATDSVNNNPANTHWAIAWYRSGSNTDGPNNNGNTARHPTSHGAQSTYNVDALRSLKSAYSGNGFQWLENRRQAHVKPGSLLHQESAKTKPIRQASDEPAFQG